MPPLEIKLGGLPTPGNGRIVALVLALGALILGFVYVLLGSRSTIASETKSELLEAKKALLDELALLERAHEQGDVGPKSYAHLKEALLDALGAILERIDGLDHELKSAQLERAR